MYLYRNYDASTARWRSSDPAGYPDGINNQFYAVVPTYALDPLGCWKMTVIGVASAPKPTQYIPSGETTVNVAVEIPLVRFVIEREEGDVGSKTFTISGQVSFNGDTWEKVSHDFTILDGMQSAQYYTPNLGKESYNLGEGNYTGTVILSAPGLNSAAGSFTINVAER